MSEDNQLEVIEDNNSNTHTDKVEDKLHTLTNAESIINPWKQNLMKFVPGVLMTLHSGLMEIVNSIYVGKECSRAAQIFQWIVTISVLLCGIIYHYRNEYNTLKEEEKKEMKGSTENTRKLWFYSTKSGILLVFLITASRDPLYCLFAHKNKLSRLRILFVSKALVLGLVSFIVSQGEMHRKSKNKNTN